MNKLVYSQNKNVILTSLAGQNNLFELNILTGAYSEISISNEELSANGFSETYKINGEEKIIAVFSFRDSLALFYDKPIMLNQKGLTASIKPSWFFKRIFELKLNNETVLNFKYFSPDVQTDVLYDVVDWLNIEPFEKRLKKLYKLSQFYLIQDKKKRLEAAYKV